MPTPNSNRKLTQLLLSLLGSLLLILALETTPAQANSSSPQAPSTHIKVVDEADIFTDTEEADLNLLINTRDRETQGARLLIYTTTRDYEGSLRDYANSLGNQWNVGDPQLKNGVTLVIDMKEQEAFLAVAEGARQQISDQVARDITQNVLAPKLAQGQYVEGARATIDDVYNLASQGATNDRDTAGILLGVGLVALLTATGSLMGGYLLRGRRRIRRQAEAEIDLALAQAPQLLVTAQMRRDYLAYRYNNQTEPLAGSQAHNQELERQEAVTGRSYTRYAASFRDWLPLYQAKPALYSGKNQLPEDDLPGGLAS